MALSISRVRFPSSVDASYSAMADQTDTQLTTAALFWEKKIVALFCTM
jgi:hypothetical protein